MAFLLLGLEKRWGKQNCKRVVLVSLLAILLGGCSRRVAAPRIDPTEATRCALAQYDANQDGLLDAQELLHCPGLWCCLVPWDKDGDSRMSQDELGRGLAAYNGSRIGLMEVVCTVTWQGRPLAQANVVLTPEAFLGGTIESARGVTDEQGHLRPRIEGISEPGCRVGIYRVSISKCDAQGREILPRHYNTESCLGLEVGPGARGQYVFHLWPR